MDLKDPIQQGLTATGITQQCNDALAKAQSLTEALRGQPSERSWRSTFGQFDAIIQAVQEASAVPQLLGVVHPSEEVRTAALACEPKVDAFATALFMDDAVASVLRTFAAQKPQLSPVQQRFVDHVLRDYRRNGLELDGAGRERLRGLNEELTKAGQAFDKNLADTTLSLEVSAEQLAGLPENYLQTHQPNENGRICITTNTPDYVPFLKYAKDRAAARELYTLANNRAADQNLPLLDTLLKLRYEKAKLLGYATWADYVLEPRMAKTPAAVKAFSDDLHTSLKPKREEEFQVFKKMAASLGADTASPIPVSDASYLEDKIYEQRYAFDSKKLNEYFEISAVQQGIMDIASRLFAVTFEYSNAPVWHADVQAFDVNGTNGPIGRIYLDLYPRDNKYKHAAVFGLRDTYLREDGTREQPLAALVCNFPKPGASPALLSHDDVTTFFHEFGHLLHHILSTSELAAFAGTSVARDFVEVPSQLFEEWAWARETLDLFARHHVTNGRIPEDLFQALLSTRTFGEVTAAERQLFLGRLDQVYHTSEPGLDTTHVVEELSKEYSSFARIPGTHFQATFGHLVGYDAAYYGYQWALSLAFDAFTRFQSEGMLSNKTATDYRKTILEPGGSKDEAMLMQDFLGRPANNEAYKKFLGINSPA
jgi:thimet oligopeptidase